MAALNRFHPSAHYLVRGFVQSKDDKSMFNRVIIAGNLTRDPEFRESVSGAAEKCREYLSKTLGAGGGRLRERVWERDGQKGRKTGIAASRVKFLPRRRDTETEVSLEPDDVEASPAGQNSISLSSS